MGAILGVGATHYPPGLVPDEYKPWPLARMLKTDRIPDHMKDPANWPEPMRAEWGTDEGITSHKAHRAQIFDGFRKIRQEIDAFNPDFILIWGDDQYENFKEDIIPPFCVLAYEGIDFQPFHKLGERPNVWGEPNDKVFHGVENFEYVQLGQITTAYYFFHFLILMPLLAKFEPTRPLPESISEPVLGKRSEAGE